MKYLVRARIKEGAENQIRDVITTGSVPGAPSYFADHLADCFAEAQQQEDGSVLWIETCYCERYFGEPLAEEKDYVTRYFELGRVKKVVAAASPAPRSVTCCSTETAGAKLKPERLRV